ncbi:uncharacterized protein ARMOST_16248 [Armillaria ostoyae]|uniref:Uncharacterized protein n=1 Tax=Armillaria ostoyae TaxID=47428 RepID=A0A284RVQ1_ARMOS|nr:uncharacterized protein ARMOST_16248 [Armillaria ostoyae]
MPPRRKKAKKTQANPPAATVTPIQAFFAQYPEFSYDPSGETMEQFWSMIRQFGWLRDDTRKTEALSGIQDAIAQQFNDIYGGNAGDLGAWQRLWEMVGEGDMPTDINACRAAIKRVFVNICDLVDYPATQSLQSQDLSQGECICGRAFAVPLEEDIPSTADSRRRLGKGRKKRTWWKKG